MNKNKSGSSNTDTDKVAPEVPDKVAPEVPDKVAPEVPDKVTPEVPDKVTPEVPDKVAALETKATVAQSLKLNYKSWLAILFVILTLTPGENPLYSLTTFLILMLVVYFTHRCTHSTSSYPLNISHLYHHTHSNFFSHFIQAILEHALVLCFIFGNMALQRRNIKLGLNNWMILFFYLFYTTIHNINYSYFHVNDVHERHHSLFHKNLGPDICDILFNTKDGPVENTDHYLYNIVGAFIFVHGLKYFYESSAHQSRILYVGKISYMTAALVLIIASVTLYVMDKVQGNPNLRC